MSLGSILNIGITGLSAAQNQIQVVSDNITNVNTQGYIRKTLSQQSTNIQGIGTGVSTGDISLVANTYLQQASFKAGAQSAQHTAYSELIDNLQSQFGDLNKEGSLLNLGNQAMSDLASLVSAPNSNVQKQTVLSSIDAFFNEATRISGQIQQVRQDANARISADIKSINTLMDHIVDLNTSISAGSVTGKDVSGARTAQVQYLDELSKLIDITVQGSQNETVTVRTTSGMTLIGQKAAQLSYDSSGPSNAATGFRPIMITGENGATRDFTEHVTSGELKGLLDIRDRESVAISAQLSEFMSSYANAFNAAHNEATAVPAPNALTGKPTAQTMVESLSGFTGKTSIMIVDSAGILQKRVDVDFTAHSLTIDGAATSSAFTDATFDTALTAALGGLGSASFSNGTLNLKANTASHGVSLLNDATNPSNKSGFGFSHYFGLNDLIAATKPLDYNTGLSVTSNHGFVAGSVVTFLAKTANGGLLGNVPFTVPAATDMGSLITALNDPTTGLGRFGNFSLDAKGKLTYSGFGTPAGQIDVTSDSTQRLGTSTSLSAFFGLGKSPNQRVDGLTVKSTIRYNSNLLANAQAKIGAVGTQVIFSGDSAGIEKLAGIATASRSFVAAGFHGQGTSSLQAYGSDLIGQVGVLSSNAESKKQAAETLADEAFNRRQAYEGVNLDEELIHLTTYQQAYSASSRIIQAAKDMYDVLLQMV